MHIFCPTFQLHLGRIFAEDGLKIRTSGAPVGNFSNLNNIKRVWIVYRCFRQLYSMSGLADGMTGSCEDGEHALRHIHLKSFQGQISAGRTYRL